MKKKILIAFLLLANSIILNAQEKSNVAMADVMRDNGKIFVVVAVILAIFAGIILYLIRLDRKISRLEENQL